MSATFEHPSLHLPVTEDQRDRAEHWLQEAYADGRVTSEEFDRRIGQVLGAGTRKELNEAFYGLVQVPSTSRAMGVHPAYQPLVGQQTKQQAGRGVAGVAHFSALLTSVFGPLLIFALARRAAIRARRPPRPSTSSSSRWSAGSACWSCGGVTGLGIFDFLIGLAFIGWVVLTVLSGAKALQGDDWTNPVKKIVKVEALSEK